MGLSNEDMMKLIRLVNNVEEVIKQVKAWNPKNCRAERFAKQFLFFVNFVLTKQDIARLEGISNLDEDGQKIYNIPPPPPLAHPARWTYSLWWVRANALTLW